MGLNVSELFAPFPDGIAVESKFPDQRKFVPPFFRGNHARKVNTGFFLVDIDLTS